MFFWRLKKPTVLEMAVLCGAKARALQGAHPVSDLGLNEDTRTSGQEALLSSQIPLQQKWLFSNIVIMVVVEVCVGVCMCVEFFKEGPFGCTLFDEVNTNFIVWVREQGV